MDPATLALLAQYGLPVIGGIAGGLSQRGQGSQSSAQKELIDQLLGSVKGKGPYSDLFNTNEEAFQKSFVQPALNRFQNQISPAIQQQYLATGQQGGSGLNDSLARAGVDLQGQIDSNYLTYMNQGKDRMQQMLQSILGSQKGESDPQSWMSTIGQSIGGAASGLSQQFGIDKILDAVRQRSSNTTTAPGQIPYREGFVN